MPNFEAVTAKDQFLSGQRQQAIGRPAASNALICRVNAAARSSPK